MQGASPEARSVIAHYTYQYSVATNNTIDGRWGAITAGTETTKTAGALQADPDNTYPDDASLYPTTGPGDGRYPARGGLLNVWVDEKPYVGQNAEIYVMLLDSYGEMSGAPIQINLSNTGPITQENPTTTANTDPAYANKKTYLAKFETQQYFIAFDSKNQPMAVDNTTAGTSLPTNAKQWPHPTSSYENGAFDDQVKYYVDITNLCSTMPTAYSADGVASGAVSNDSWVSSWGDINLYIRKITAGTYLNGYDTYTTGTPASEDDRTDYAYLLAPSGGIAQPCAFKEGTSYVYKMNVPSVLYQDIVLVDYYKEYVHNATQVSILPDKFAPYMYVEGSSLVRRASDGIDLPVEFVIPKFKITTALTFTLASTGDPSTFNFAGDAYPDYSKFDLTRKVLADIQILDADDNGASEEDTGDPTSYRRFAYNDGEGEYLWKDPSIEAHQNINYADAYDYTIDQTGNQNQVYAPTIGGPESVTPGDGVIDTNP